MLSKASQLPLGCVVFVDETETLYVRVRDGFRPATVSHRPASLLSRAPFCLYD